MELREYQRTIVERAKAILSSKKFVYLAMEVRTGKTLTSLSIAEEMGVERVLFLKEKRMRIYDREEALYDKALEHIKNAARKAGKKIRILDKCKVLPYGPRIWKICIEFRVLV